MDPKQMMNVKFDANGLEAMKATRRVPRPSATVLHRTTVPHRSARNAGWRAKSDASSPYSNHRHEPSPDIPGTHCPCLSS